MISLRLCSSAGWAIELNQFNVIATSGRAVKACGDINTLILDKTGTITEGNRLASEFIPVNGHSCDDG